MLFFFQASLCSPSTDLVPVILYLKAELPQLMDSFRPLTEIRTQDQVSSIQKSTAIIFLVCLDVCKNNFMKLNTAALRVKTGAEKALSI